MIRPRYFFTLGPLTGTPLTRYAIVAADGQTVIGVQVSMPDTDLLHIERPTHLRWLRGDGQDVRIRTWRINETPIGKAGEQPRRPTWRRAGRTASNVEAA